AEDGIRDYKVTGVQTCALPIWFSSTFRPGASRQAERGREPRDRRPLRGQQHPDRAAAAGWAGGWKVSWSAPQGGDRPAAGRVGRSEERRVGKEWRAGG